MCVCVCVRIVSAAYMHEHGRYGFERDIIHQNCFVNV